MLFDGHGNVERRLFRHILQVPAPDHCTWKLHLAVVDSYWIGLVSSETRMKPEEILRIVDAIHRDKNIDKEIVFQAIESALVTALLRHYGEEAEVIIRINRQSGAIAGTHDGTNIDPEEITGRIGAQTAKQVIIQKIREAERDSIHDEYEEQVGQMVSGLVTRFDGGVATVSL